MRRISVNRAFLPSSQQMQRSPSVWWSSIVGTCSTRSVYLCQAWMLLHSTATSVVLRTVDLEVPSWKWRSRPACHYHSTLGDRWTTATICQGQCCSAMCSGLYCVPHQLFLQTFLPEAVLVTDGEVGAIPMPWNIWIDNQYFLIYLFGLFRQQMNPSLRVTSLDPSYTTRHELHC